MVVMIRHIPQASCEFLNKIGALYIKMATIRSKEFSGSLITGKINSCYSVVSLDLEERKNVTWKRGLNAMLNKCSFDV